MTPKSVRGVVATLLVLGGFVAVIVFLVPMPSSIRQPVPDVASAARDAEPALGFAPSVPTGLGEGWTPTSVLVQEGVDGTPTWRVNYKTPKGWASLIQGAGATRKWESVQIVDGGERGSAVVAGRTWVIRAREDRSLTAYVLRDPEVTTMVAGRTSREELEALIRATPLSAD